MTLGPHNLPETWECGPIHWKLVDAEAPAGADDLARRTFVSITAASGVTFVEDTPLSKLPGQFDDTDYNGRGSVRSTV